MELTDYKLRISRMDKIQLAASLITLIENTQNTINVTRKVMLEHPVEIELDSVQAFYDGKINAYTEVLQNIDILL